MCFVLSLTQGLLLSKPNTSSLFRITHARVYLRFFFQVLFLALRFELICFSFRAPNPDTVLVMQTPLGVISTKCLLQNKKKSGSRLISYHRTKLEETLPVDNIEQDPFSAARCRIFQRTNRTKKVFVRRILHLLMKTDNVII